MVGTSSSSSSSCASFGSFDDISAAATAKTSSAAAATGTIKFLCSYGGRILPRYPDGKLRYVGGDTRVLSVHRSLPFQELEAKMKEMCGWEKVYLRCQLPTEDLDALVSVTSDEDLANLVEEYDLATRDRLLPLKIRAFLLPPPPPPPKPSTKTPSPPSTFPIAASSCSAAAARSISPSFHSHASRAPLPADLRFFLHPSAAAAAAAPPRFHP
ncbi:uncharacterized protein LOC109723365, partial [Ananas comosus]|uniref:Uncharacterized protein LOC109723365 n=1 Tax=Ananas comosus TaxID=4615 RepID=A0A6P5GPF3_ANACO